MTEMMNRDGSNCMRLDMRAVEESSSYLILGDRRATRDGSTKEYKYPCIYRAMVAGLERFDMEMSEFAMPQIDCTEVVPRIDEEGRFFITCGRGWMLTGDTISFPQDPRTPRIQIIHGLGEHIGRVLGLPYVYIQAGTGAGRIVVVSAANMTDLRVPLRARASR